MDMNLPLSPTLRLAQALIQCPSVTPHDAGCQPILIQRLKTLGFTIVPCPMGAVDNFWAIRGKTVPIIAFAGHTDVVPPGDLNAWRIPPFSGVIENGYLYGRGAADMKGSLAAMITACERFLTHHPNHVGSIAFLITSDEEGPAIDGTQRLMHDLSEKNIQLDYCIVGEPSSRVTLGDTLKIGRRGSLSGTLIIEGVQGHIAYPMQAVNPIHLSIKPLEALINQTWDNGNTHFSPTSFQISNVHAGVGVGNVIPGSLECRFNFRYSTVQTAESLKQQVCQILNTCAIPYHIHWELPSLPFLTAEGQLLETCAACIQSVLNITPTLSTDGGTSDGRFIAAQGVEVVELGPCNATIHQVNESVNIQSLDQLSTVYESILESLLLLNHFVP